MIKAYNYHMPYSALAYSMLYMLVVIKISLTWNHGRIYIYIYREREREGEREREKVVLRLFFQSFTEAVGERESMHVPWHLGGIAIQKGIQAGALTNNSNQDLCMPRLLAIPTPQQLLQLRKCSLLITISNYILLIMIRSEDLSEPI